VRLGRQISQAKSRSLSFILKETSNYWMVLRELVVPKVEFCNNQFLKMGALKSNILVAYFMF
jgi:hypothetical protein